MPKNYSVVQYDENNSLFFTANTSCVRSYEYFRSSYASLLKLENNNLDQLRTLSLQYHYSVPTHYIFEKQEEVRAALSDHHLLPLAVRYISKDGSYYIERPPFKINISYKNSRAYVPSKVIQDLQIWIPWTMTVIPPSFINKYDPSNVKIFYSDQSLKNSKTSYVYSLFPNAYHDGRICWSNSFNAISSGNQVKEESSSFDFRYWHSMMFNDYMLGGWNTDIFSLTLSLITKQSRIPIVQEFFQNNVNSETFPLLHKYQSTENYKDVYNAMLFIFMDKFDFSKLKSQKILSHQYHNNDYESNIHYVRLFSFMSLLSLDETLSFYREIIELNKLIKKKERSFDSMHFRDFHSSLVIEFSKMVTNNNLDLDDPSYLQDSEYANDIGFPIQYPLARTISGNNPKYSLEQASSIYKNIKILFILQNFNDRQDDYLSYDTNMNDWDDIIWFFEKEKFDMSSFYKYLNSLKNSTDSTIFIKVNCAKKTYEVCTFQDYIDYISVLKLNVLDTVSSIKQTKSNSSYYERVNSVLIQENPALVFNI